MTVVSSISTVCASERSEAGSTSLTCAALRITAEAWLAAATWRARSWGRASAGMQAPPRDGSPRNCPANPLAIAYRATSPPSLLVQRMPDTRLGRLQSIAHRLEANRLLERE